MGNSLEKRFWAKVDKNGPVMAHMGTPCWVWRGTATLRGYGQIRSPGRRWMTHRLSYLWHYGELPEGKVVDHRCHRPCCVNPEHLRLVTQKENMENRSGPQRGSASGARGVSWQEARQKWLVRVYSDGKSHFGGRFASLADAEVAAVTLRNKLYTHNDIDRVVV